MHNQDRFDAKRLKSVIDSYRDNGAISLEIEDVAKQWVDYSLSPDTKSLAREFYSLLQNKIGDELEYNPSFKIVQFKNYIEELHLVINQTIKSVAFSGGGVKGAMYPGAYRALCECPQTVRIENVAGSSAGAIFATFVAFGASQKQIDDLSKTNLQELQGPGMLIINPHTGVPLENWVNRNIKSIALSGLTKIWGSKRKRAMAYYGPYQQAIAALIAHLGSEEYGLTFKDLDLLNTLDPKTFKTLNITAVNTVTGDVTVFNAHNSPNVDICAAVRASAALPAVFARKNIGGTLYTDGGYKDNTPFDALYDKNGILRNKPEETLIFAFSEKPVQSRLANMDRYLYHKTEVREYELGERLTYDILPQCYIGNIGGSIQPDQALNETIRKVYPLSTIPLETTLTTTDFDHANRRRELYSRQGYYQTMQHLVNHDLSDRINTPELKQNFQTQRFFLDALQSLVDGQIVQWPREQNENNFIRGIVSALRALSVTESLTPQNLQGGMEALNAALALNSNTLTRAEQKVQQNLMQILRDQNAPSQVKAFYDTISFKGLIKRAFKNLADQQQWML